MAKQQQLVNQQKMQAQHNVHHAQMNPEQNNAQLQMMNRPQMN